jgi:hypothetical protein
MNNPIFNILMATNRWFVVVGVIISTLLGMIWYGPALFGNLYGKWMNIKMEGVSDEEKKASMMRSMPWELLSRVLYFIGLGYALQMSGWTSIGMALIFSFVVWLVFIFPANMSQTTWSNCDMRALWLIAGNTLLATLLATTVWFYFLS